MPPENNNQLPPVQPQQPTSAPQPPSQPAAPPSYPATQYQPIPPTNPVTSPNPPPSQPAAQTMEELEPGEHLITIIHRHFFGIFYIYVLTAIALTVGIGLIYFLLPNFVDTSRQDIYKIVALVSGLIVGAMALIMILATFIYYSSKLILSDRHITQIIRVGIFNKKISQLDIGNIEDVNASRKGFFASVLNFGSLNIETAGEVENFTFNYCPQPDHYAKEILEARDQVRALRRGQF